MSILPAAGYLSDGARTEGEMKQALEDQRSCISELPGGTAETELTISGGTITPTGALHRVDTEADAGTDQLDHISITNHPEGRQLRLRLENAARVVTVRHGQGGDGQILLRDSADLTFNGGNHFLDLIRSGTTWIEVGQFPQVGKYVNRNYAEYTTNAGLSAQITLDDSIPQNTEGTEILTCAITPKKTTNRVRVTFQGQISGTGQVHAIVALFRDSVADALAATFMLVVGANLGSVVTLTFEHSPGTTSAVTYKVRAGPAAAETIRFNGNSAGRLLGGASRATLVVEEIEP